MTAVKSEAEARRGELPTTTRREVRGACPMDCPDTCSWVVTVEGGRAVKLAGDRDHPHTRGALCVKLNRYLEHTRAPDRLLHPLRRVGRKGEGRFERISWDEALHEISSRWQRVIERHGPQAIWPYYGTGTLGMIQGTAGAGRRLANALGTSRHLMTICMIAGAEGTGYVLGDNRVGMDPEGFAESRLILLWGANPLSTGHHLWKFITAARKQGAHLVAIDPIRTRSAAQADEHLAPVPGTDAALALGLMHHVVSAGAEDREFVAEHTLGWEAFRERVMEFTPQRVATITGIPEERIRALGERLASTRPTGIKVGIGMQRHGGGGTAIRAITSIPGVTGDWRYSGGGTAYDTRGFFPANWSGLWRDDLRPPGTRSLNMTRLGEALLELDDPPVDALFVYGSNPVASAPHQGKVRRGLEREDLFTVVVEQFPTDTVDYADIVLPATMQPEHADLHCAYGHLYLAWNEPAVKAPGECLPNSEIFRRLAASLGLTEPSLYDSDEEMARQALDVDHPHLAGITLEKLKRDGWSRLNLPRPFVPFAEGNFPTPSGKLEFYSERAEADGLDPLPGYTPPNEAAGDAPSRYPLALIAPASHNFLNSIFANKPALREKQGPFRISLHPEDAAARDLRPGDTARVHNDRGAFRAEVEVTDATRPGVVASSKGYWPKLLGTNANVNATVDERDADMGGGAVFHDNRVEVEKA
jgi:anaerobic selenocysteine-containing dehydrogenase